MAWAQAHGHRVVAWAEDVVTGKVDGPDRPGLGEVLAAIEDGEVEGVIAAKLDRVARQLTVQEAVLGHVWALGGIVYTADMGEVLEDDPDDPMRTAQRQMIGVFAQLERATIAARMRAGRRLKHSRGGYAGFGSPHFGRRAEGKELVVDVEEMATVRRIVELRRNGCSLSQICDVLTFERRKPKRGATWWPRTVARILDRAGAETPA